MKKEYIEYASKLNKIGDKIVTVSHSIPVLDSKRKFSLEEMNIFKEQLSKAVDNYQSIVNELRDIKAPDTVKKDHEKLISGVGSFVHGCSLMKESVDILKLTLNKDQLLQGDSIRVIGINVVNEATKSIGDKLSQ